jgi:hypothetical protein
VATLLTVGMLSACTEPGTSTGQNARADIQVSLSQGLDSGNVVRISVVVEGPGISPPIIAELTRNASGWSGVIQDIPAGADRFFTATGYDAGSVPLYKGQAGPISVLSNSTVSVGIMLQPVNPPPPFENVAPIIESLVASSNPVQPGATLTLTARALDPNPGDTLSYGWSAPAGTFGSPGSVSTSWTAPANEGVMRIALEVKDSRGASSTLSLDIHVLNPSSVGSATVTTRFNAWPTISSMAGTPSPLVPGVPTKLFVSAVDPDGDALLFSWSASCPGAFDNPTLPQPSFTLADPNTSDGCTFSVMLSDGRGGQQRGSLTLHIHRGRPTNQPPQLVRAYNSSGEAGANEVITLGVLAQDPEGQPLAFSWQLRQGVIRANRTTPTSSELDWQAPSCFDAPVPLTVILQDGGGASTSHTFAIAPRAGATCGGTSVTGVRNVTHVVDGVIRVSLPDDLSTLTIGAWVPTADGLGYEYRAGTGQSDGTFSIPDVQRTPYFLQLGTSYTWTTSRRHDLRRAVLGRPDAEPLPVGSQLDLRLTGLTPWKLDNDVQFHAPAVGLGYLDAPNCSFPGFPIVEGETFTSGTLDYYDSLQACGNATHRLDGSRGDVLYVTELVGRATPGTDATVRELRQAFQTQSMPETSAGLFELTGTMAPLPLTRQPVDFRLSEFEALALAAHPEVRLTMSSVHLGTLMGYDEFGIYTGWPDLAMASDTTPGGGDSFMLFEYGDPYPGSWPRFIHSVTSAGVYYSVPLPDGTNSQPRVIAASVISRVSLRPGMTHVVRPQVGPPQELRLNGLPTTTSRSGVGPTPLVSWKPPLLGLPNLYAVRVYRFTATSSGSTTRTLVGTLNTTETQLRLPPNFLVATGNSIFAIQVYAYSEPHNGTANHYASVLTSGFTP